jgi:vitamin B12 transporter
VSYSYLDSKRNYLDYPISATPSFVSDHNFSIVYKQFFPKISMNAGASVTYATGRPYYNPNNPVFMADKTSDYLNLGINFSYVRKIRKSFTVFVLSFGNVLGRENIFSYRYSIDGSRREPTLPASTRNVFIGIFMSFGQDRSNEVD